MQQLYLDSLYVLGIDPHAHDIRFVEDNWEQPSLGAWGLGWEVQMDGMEVTQFTYFQQVGSVDLEPRVGRADVRFGASGYVSCKTLHTGSRSNTRRGSRWATSAATSRCRAAPTTLREVNAPLQRQLFDSFEGEAQRLLELDLVYPAYEFVMKASHAFNLTRRTRRALAHGAAKLRSAFAAAFGRNCQTLPRPDATPNGGGVVATLLFEIGTEELPSWYVSQGRMGLGRLTAERLTAAGVSFDGHS